MMKKRFAALLLVLVLAAASLASHAEPSGFADILRSIDYGDRITYVIGHKSPDADAIGSSVAYAYLLQQLGINAKAVSPAKVNQETRYALDFFGLEEPEILDNAAGKQFVLVDHSEYSHALDGVKQARVVGVVDHHGIGDIRNTERIAVISLPVGATSSIIYKLFQECNVGIPADIARIMLMSILSDTRDMTDNVTALDQQAYDFLLSVADISDIDVLYAGMKEAATSFDGLTPSEIFYNDYKEYLAGEYTFGIGNVTADSEESAAELAKLIEAEFPSIYASNNLDILFCMISTGNSTYLFWHGEDAEKAVRDSFPDYGGGGYLVFSPGVSRKVSVVPPLTMTLEEWTEAGKQLSPSDQ